MSQARVTDFFTQRKRGDGSTRVKGPKEQQQRVGDNGHSAFGLPAARPKTRSTRSKNIDTLSTNSAARSAGKTNAIQEEFLRVIEEATGSFGKTQVESRPGDFLSRSDSTEPQKTFPASPRTPKRTSTDAEFDLGAAVFTTTADHSSAKKRLRLEAKKDVPVQSFQRPVKKTARKKLILTKDNEQAVQPLVKDVETPSLPSPVDEKFENVDKSYAAVLHAQDQDTTLKSKQAKQTLSKDSVSALKARLQKIKNQAERLSYSAPGKSPQPQPSTTEPSLSTKLDRARELAARAQRRKAERETEQLRSAEEQPTVQDGESTPGYQRYHSLAQSVPPSLSLPYQYKLLAEMFRSMDTIVGMLYNRSETVTFSKIKQAVQDMMHKRFEESHVGQIKTVFPSAYSFRQESNIPNFSTSARKGSFQLTIEPVIHTEKSDGRPSLTASLLLERRQAFHYNLVAMVKQHHKVFLSSLSPAMTVPEDKLTRWHPRFQVDQVPLVQPSPLPQPPQTENLTTAQQVLDRARSIMTPKMEKALANMTLKTAEMAARGQEASLLPPQPSSLMTPPATPIPQTLAPVPKTPSALKGVSQSLLERIRAKEAQKLQAAMTRNPEQEGRLLMMSRLSELARILRNVFVAEKKQALIMELACSRMVASYRSALSSGEMERHLRLLADLVPDWLKIHLVRKDFYLKLNKSVELNIILEKINQKMREEERL